jgi:hypothetical protein
MDFTAVLLQLIHGSYCTGTRCQFLMHSVLCILALNKIYTLDKFSVVPIRKIQDSCFVTLLYRSFIFLIYDPVMYFTRNEQLFK